MYGIVNKAVEGLVCEKFGLDAWNEIKSKSGFEDTTFLANKMYEDSVTYTLAIKASEILKIDLRDILLALGEYWVLKTGKQHYGALMEAGGKNLKDFLVNLPNFHSRVMLYYPNISPPEFKTKVLDDNQIEMHYFSKRAALAPFVEGLMFGLAKMFDTTISIKHTEIKDTGADHDIFLIQIEQ